MRPYPHGTTGTNDCDNRRMVPESYHDFFVGCTSVAGALIGLLFVAISVAGVRLTQDTARAQVHRIRASAALTAFTNSLTVSLFALIPGHKIGYTTVAVGVGGLTFVAGSLVALARVRHLKLSNLRDALFVIGLAVVFVYQVFQGLDIANHPDDVGAVDTVAILVVICFLVGIARSWELIDAPSIGITHEVTDLVRHGRTGNEPEDATEPAAKEPDVAASAVTERDQAPS
jgi:hypothetical protein